MELLTIKHQDFEMIVECAKFDDIWYKAKSNIGEECLHSTYSWSEGVSSVILSNYIGEEITIENSQQAPAIFFDNTDYPIWVEFKNYVKKAQFGSMLQSENEKFTFRRQILAGFLNYGNEVGRSEIQLMYQVGTETRSFVFSFEVLSTKLNYHEHWKAIIEDVEQEYRMLSLDYMRRTFHGFSPETSGDTPEIIWWSVFANEQKNFIKACKNIIDRPRHRLHGKETYKRADKLTFVPSCIENELAEHRQDSSHLYRVEERIRTNDTQENRFLKFALGQITSVPTIREIAKAYAPAHAFALFLFRQQVRELKLAAAFIDDPSEVTAAQMREWADGLTNTELVEQVVSALFRHAPDDPDMALEWMGSPEPMKRYAGLLTAASVIRAEKNRAWAGRFFEQADRIARRGDLESFVGRGLVMLMRSLATVSPSLCERVKLWEQLCAASADGTLREVAGELQWQLEYMEGGSD